MKKSLPWLMLLGGLLLIGCASKKDANEKNFSEALNSYLAKKGQLCLGIPSPWPVDLNEAERRSGMGTATEMAALEKVGLVRSHEAETEYMPPLSSRPVKTKVLRYELTDNGKTFYREKDRLGLAGNKQVQGDLCYGQQALDKIVNWQGPTAAGDSKEATVSIHTGSRILPTGQRIPIFKEFFPELFRPLTGDKNNPQSSCDAHKRGMGSERTRQLLDILSP